MAGILHLLFILFLFPALLLGQSKTPFVSDTTIDHKKLFGFKVQGHFSIPPTYVEAHAFHDGLALVREDQFYTYIDHKGEKVAKLHFVEAKDFSEGLAAVKMSTGWGFVNVHLNTVIPAEYRQVKSFSEGAAAVKKNKWEFINKHNKALFPFESDTVVANFSNGAAIVGVFNGRWLYGLMSEKGKWLVDPQYLAVQLLSKGLFSAETSSGYFELLNSTGRRLFSQLEFVRMVNDTVFLSEKEGFCHLLNQQGAIISRQGFKEISSLGKVVPFPSWKIVDTSWKEIVAFEADSFSVLEDHILRHLNDKRQIVWPVPVAQWLERIEPFTNTYWKVRHNGKWSLMTKKGELKWPFEQDYINQKGPYWWMGRNNGITLYDSLGQPLLKNYYEWLALTPSGRLMFRQADSCGYFSGAHSKRSLLGGDSLTELGREFFLFWKGGSANLLNDTLNVSSPKRFSGGKQLFDTLLVLYDKDSVYKYNICTGKAASLSMHIKSMLNDTLAWAKTDTLSGVYHFGTDSLYHIRADTVWHHPDLPTRLCIRKGDTLALADLAGRWQSSYNRNLRYIGRLENGYLPVIARKRQGFADTNGFLRIATQYDSVGKPSQGYFAVKIKAKWGVVDYKERFVIHPNYSKAGVMRDGKIAMWSGPLAMLVNKEGQELFNPRFHDIQPSLFGYWKTRKGGNYGFLNAEAREILTPRFEKVEPLAIGYFIVQQYGKVGILDKKLQEVWPLKEKSILSIKNTSLFAVQQPDR